MSLKYYRLCAGIWFLMMLFILFLPGGATPEVSPLIPHFDKIIHAGIFYVLTWLVFKSLKVQANTSLQKDFVSNCGKKDVLKSEVVIILWFTGIVIFALMSELIQAYFISGRGGDILDFLADLFGISLVAIWGFSKR